MTSGVQRSVRDERMKEGDDMWDQIVSERKRARDREGTEELGSGGWRLGSGLQWTIWNPGGVVVLRVVVVRSERHGRWPDSGEQLWQKRN